MFSVGYYILCINLLYYFDQAETCFSMITRKVPKNVKVLNPITVENQDFKLATMISPYFEITYNEELILKQKRCRAILNSIKKSCESYKHLKNFMTLRLHKIIPSPVYKAYRNKDVYTIGNGADGNPKTVGFKIGNNTQGRVCHVRPTKISTIKESHKRIAKVFEDFIRLSPLPVSFNLLDGGYWRELHVRSNLEGNAIATVIVQTRGHAIETILNQKLEMRKYFYRHLRNITLYLQECPFRRCSHGEAPFNSLNGLAYFMDYLNGYKFKITPATFFPTNKLASEVLYNTIIRNAHLKPSTTVIDLYSQSAIISIMVSKHVKEVIMIHSVYRSVSDGRFVAKLNKIRNIKYLLGKKEVESTLKNLATPHDIVAIYSSRASKPDWNALKSVRDNSQISKLFYVSTKPSSPFDILNFDILCSNNRSKSRPFKLIETTPIDILPRTKFLQFILKFQR